LNERHLQAQASVGVTLYPQHGDDAEALLRQAEAAMSVAKRNEQAYVFYAAELDTQTSIHLQLMSNLRQAIAADQLELHYQPAIDLRTGQPRHLEALVRWQHPQHGLLLPEDFVPLAEQSGLIKPLTYWVLKAALRQCSVWQKAGLDVDIAVNLPALSLRDVRLVDEISRLARTWSVSPHKLKVEIDQSAVAADSARARDVLRRLRELGVRISIDEFGRRQSSLASLRRLSVDELELARPVVAGMANNEDDAFIAQSVVQLGHYLGLEVVADGVDSRETRDMLAAMGCDIAQGFDISRPLTAPEVAVWFEEQGRRLSAVS
jgi:EAL domain-containing protein (putative c-di-GMP-specific phosphodiesterase class I)